MMNIFNKTGSEAGDSLVDEKENKALLFILFLAVLGIVLLFAFAWSKYHPYSIIYSMAIVAAGIFASASSLGFLFGIPRTASNNDNDKYSPKYIGNDNLLQISDWLTKIIIGVGLTQLYNIPIKLVHLARYIAKFSGFRDESFVLFIVIFYLCLGFLFGYLWTRLYFIKMLKDSDDDMNDDAKNNEKTIGISAQNMNLNVEELIQNAPQ